MKKILNNQGKNVIRKTFQKWVGRIIVIPLVFVVLSILCSAKTYADSFAVQGVISTSSAPVRYASITFLNSSDTTNKLTALTDTSGHYQINVLTVVKPSSNVPKTFELAQNYPNPFSSSTTIPYSLET